VGAAEFLALVEGDDDRLRAENLAVHLSDGAGGLLGGRVADEAKALGGLGLVVTHDAGTGDGAEGSEGLAEDLISDAVIEVLHVQVHALVLRNTLLVKSVDTALDFTGALSLLLGAIDVELEGGTLVLNGFVGKLCESLLSRGVLSEVNETEALGLSIGVTSDDDASNRAKGGEELLKLVFGVGLRELLHVEVGPVVLASAVLATNERSDVHLVIVNEVAVELLNGILSGFSSFVVNVAVALGVAVLIGSDLARKDVSEHGEGVEKTLVVDSRSQVLNEDVSDATLTKAGITLRPHNSAGSALNIREVHGIKCTLSILNVVEVHICVSKRSSGNLENNKIQ
jgi:hypothetical protein